MRNDMAKVIVERPRKGRAYAKVTKNKGSRKLPPDLSQIGLAKFYAITAARKGLNENLTPLARFLDAQIGRPWDKVWSEICENLKPSSTVQQHVRDHIPDFVAIKTAWRDGEIWVAAWFGRPVTLKETGHYLFVDPRSGLLRKNPHYQKFHARRKERDKQKRAERDARMREADRWRQYHLLDDGAWWEVTLASCPAQTQPQPRDAVLAAGLSTLPPADLFGRAGVYAVEKRQLSARDVKALKLKG